MQHFQIEFALCDSSHHGPISSAGVNSFINKIDRTEFMQRVPKPPNSVPSIGFCHLVTIVHFLQCGSGQKHILTQYHKDFTDQCCGMEDSEKLNGNDCGWKKSMTKSKRMYVCKTFDNYSW